jgi:hypothetical protein
MMCFRSFASIATTLALLAPAAVWAEDAAPPVIDTGDTAWS